MGGRRGAAAAFAGAVLLLACAHHLTGRGEDTVLIKRDKYGIPVDGSDNAHPSPARAMASGREAAGEAHEGLEIKTNSISKVLNSIQDEASFEFPILPAPFRAASEIPPSLFPFDPP
jgi:hypothetical protein